MSTEVSNKKRKPPVPPVAIVNAAMRLRRFLLRAADMVVPPHLAVYDRFMGAAQTMLIHSAAQHRIADILAKEGPLGAAEIAARIGVPAEPLDRILGALVSIGVFRQDAAGRFSNNRVSKGLITGSAGGIRGFTDFFGRQHVLRAWADLPATLRGEGPGFDRVHGRSIWAWLDGDDEARAAFVEGMSSMTEMIAPAIAASYPFGEVTRICDVGGGVGIVLAAALDRHPHLRGVLFDGEAMLGEAPRYLDAAGVSERVELVRGSFLESVPRGADAYLLKTVIHNWDDDRALKILENCRAAMDPGHRLLVVDFVNEPDAISTLVPFMDMAGLMMFGGGRERSTDEMSRLFQKAGFRLGRVVPLPGCQAVFEGIAITS